MTKEPGSFLGHPHAERGNERQQGNGAVGFFCFWRKRMGKRLISVFVAVSFSWQQIAWAERLDWWEDQQQQNDLILAQANAPWQVAAQQLVAVHQAIEQDRGIERKLFAPSDPASNPSISLGMGHAAGEGIGNPDRDGNGEVDLGDLVKIVSEFGRGMDIMDLVATARYFGGSVYGVVTERVNALQQIWVFKEGMIIALADTNRDGKAESQLVGTYQKKSLDAEVDSLEIFLNRTEGSILLSAVVEKKTRQLLAVLVTNPTDSLTSLWEVTKAFSVVISKRNKREVINQDDLKRLEQALALPGLSAGVSSQVWERIPLLAEAQPILAEAQPTLPPAKPVVTLIPPQEKIWTVPLGAILKFPLENGVTYQARVKKNGVVLNKPSDVILDSSTGRIGIWAGHFYDDAQFEVVLIATRGGHSVASDPIMFNFLKDFGVIRSFSKPALFVSNLSDITGFIEGVGCGGCPSTIKGDLKEDEDLVLALPAIPDYFQWVEMTFRPTVTKEDGTPVAVRLEVKVGESNTPQLIIENPQVGTYRAKIILERDGLIKESQELVVTIKRLIRPLPPTSRGPVNTAGIAGKIITVSSNIKGERVIYSLLEGAPAGVTINATNGQIRWTPTLEQMGKSYSFKVKGTNSGGSVSETVTITVNENQAPVSSGPISKKITVGRTVSFASTISDPEKDPLIYSLEGAPAGVSIDPNTGQITTTALNTVATYSFTVKATERWSSRVKSESVRLEVKPPSPPAKPVITLIQPVKKMWNLPRPIKLKFTPEESVTYTVQGKKDAEELLDEIDIEVRWSNDRGEIEISEFVVTEGGQFEVVLIATRDGTSVASDPLVFNFPKDLGVVRDFERPALGVGSGSFTSKEGGLIGELKEKEDLVVIVDMIDFFDYADLTFRPIVTKDGALVAARMEVKVGEIDPPRLIIKDPQVGTYRVKLILERDGITKETKEGMITITRINPPTPPDIQLLKEWRDPASGILYQFREDGKPVSITTPSGKKFFIEYVGSEIRIKATGADNKAGGRTSLKVTVNADGSYNFTIHMDGKEFQISDAVRKVLIDGKKTGTERILDEKNSLIQADDKSETILELDKGDFTVRMKFDQDKFDAIHILNKGRALTPQEMEFVLRELEIESAKFIEISSAQREQDRANFIKFTDEVKVKLTEKLGAEKAAVVVDDLRRAGEKLIEDPNKAKEIKSELSQKKPQAPLTKEEWKSASQILEGVAEKVKDAGLKIDANGNVAGGFLTYFAGEGVEFLGDPLKFGEGIGKATVAANQGHYGEAVLYGMQDLLRVATAVPVFGRLAKAANQGIEKAIVSGKVVELETKIANRFAQAWRNLWRPWEKVYETGKGIIRSNSKNLQFYDELGNLRTTINSRAADGTFRAHQAVADDAVNLLREGKIRAEDVAELAKSKILNQDKVVNSVFNGYKENINSGKSLKALTDVLKETNAVRGVENLPKSEVATIRYYIREGLEQIKESGKIKAGESGRIFLTPQQINTANQAEQLLALPSKPTAYVEIPIERIKGSVEQVRRVEEQFGKSGQGVEIATSLKEINISDLKIHKLVE